MLFQPIHCRTWLVILSLKLDPCCLSGGSHSGGRETFPSFQLYFPKDAYRPFTLTYLVRLSLGNETKQMSCVCGYV